MTFFRLLSWTATAVVAAALAPTLDPWLDLDGMYLPVGMAAGAALFAVLGRCRISPRSIGSIPRARVVARVVVLTVRAAQEEAVWRALVLGLLAGPVGRAGALAGSTVLFAATHVRRQGRRAVVHLATGGVFGLAYVSTGRLGAAIGAHTSYNVLIGIGLLTRSDMSVTATSRTPPGVVRSPEGSSRPRPANAPRAPVPLPTVASLEAVSKSFGPVRALDCFDLELHPGEILGLLGPNGAGKSTAISLLLGLRRPDSGRSLLFGRDPREPVARRRIGVVPQEISLPPVLRVGELVDLVRAHFADPVPSDELLPRFDLAEVAGKQIGGLSVGQRRRLAVAAALAGRPTALFLDEPTAAIDASGRRVLWDELSTFVAAGGAVLLTTQQLEEAERYATRLVVISRGRVVGEGTVADVRARVGRTRISLRADRLPPLPPSAAVSSTLDRHVVYVDDPEAFIAELVRSEISYGELEVARPTLEDAFVSLTGAEE